MQDMQEQVYAKANKFCNVFIGMSEHRQKVKAGGAVRKTQCRPSCKNQEEKMQGMQ